jgi:hypothetical protein
MRGIVAHFWNPGPLSPGTLYKAPKAKLPTAPTTSPGIICVTLSVIRRKAWQNY